MSTFIYLLTSVCWGTHSTSNYYLSTLLFGAFQRVLAEYVSPVLYCAARIAGGWKLRATYPLNGSLGTGIAEYAFVLGQYPNEYVIPVQVVSGANTIS
jgi:hypothetical protein